MQMNILRFVEPIITFIPGSKKLVLLIYIEKYFTTELSLQSLEGNLPKNLVLGGFFSHIVALNYPPSQHKVPINIAKGVEAVRLTMAYRFKNMISNIQLRLCLAIQSILGKR